MKALVDTGAEVTVMNYEFYHSHLKHPADANKISMPKSPLVAANGAPIIMKGELTFSMRISGISRVISSPVLLVSNVRTDLILGADIMRKESLAVHPEHGLISSSGLEVTVTKQRTLPPRSERWISVSTLSKSQNVTVFYPSHESFASSLQTDGLRRVLCQNPSDLPLSISRGMHVGHLENASETDISDDLVISEVKKGVEQHLSSLKPSDQVSLDHLNNQKDREMLKSLIDEFPNVFSLNPTDIGHCEAITQKIMLKDEAKVACTPPYRLAPALQPIVKEYVDKLLLTKVIQKSTSPFCSPLLLVKKAGSKTSQPLVEQYRVVHDFRRLNDNTIRDSYPLHNLYDLIDKVAAGKVWSVIDLSSGFWNQGLHSESRPYTAFAVPGVGHFEYLRTAQGLCNSPAAFQRLLDYVVRGIEGVYVYIDDVVIATQDMESHLKAVRQVFERFAKFNLKCRPKKVQLATDEINYLGYNLTKTLGIRPGAAKVKAIENWTAPTNVKEIRQFLGLCSFFRRTIEGFATLAAPLTKLTRKDSGFTSGNLPSEALKAFNSIREKLMKRPCLQPPNFTRDFILTVDASTSGLGAILSQVGNHGVEHPVAYASRGLTDAETRYAPFRLEYLALWWGCKYFKPYLVGRRFTVRTDHKPLLSFNKVSGNVYDRYLLDLAEYDFQMEYLKGTTMPADGLSRQCADLHQIQRNINISWSQLKELQKQDKEIKGTVIYHLYGEAPKSESLKEAVLKLAKGAKVLEGVLVNEQGQAVAPMGLRMNLIRLAHDSEVAGHFSVAKTLHKLQSWDWPTKTKDVEVYCRSCPKCLEFNPKRQSNFPLQQIPPSKDFNDRVHIDLLGPLPINNGKKYVLVMVDSFTKFIQLAALDSKTMNNASESFYERWISTFGVCENLVSDLGLEFHNSVFKHLSEKLGITHRFSAAAHPMSNGQAETGVKETLRYVRKYVEENEWLALLPNIQFAHNTAFHEGSRMTPHEAVFLRPPMLPTTLVTPSQAENSTLAGRHAALLRTREEILINNQDQFDRNKAQYDKTAGSTLYSPGDKVYLFRNKKGTQFQKFQPKFEGPFVVLEILPLGNLKIVKLNSTGKPKRVHVNNVRRVPFLLPLGEKPLSDLTASRTPEAPLVSATQAYDGMGNPIEAILDDDETETHALPHSDKNNITPVSGTDIFLSPVRENEGSIMSEEDVQGPQEAQASQGQRFLRAAKALFPSRVQRAQKNADSAGPRTRARAQKERETKQSSLATPFMESASRLFSPSSKTAPSPRLSATDKSASSSPTLAAARSLFSPKRGKKSHVLPSPHSDLSAVRAANTDSAFSSSESSFPSVYTVPSTSAPFEAHTPPILVPGEQTGAVPRRKIHAKADPTLYPVSPDGFLPEGYYADTLSPPIVRKVRSPITPEQVLEPINPGSPVVRRPRGRPKGKTAKTLAKEAELQKALERGEIPEKRKPGRPKGQKNVLLKPLESEINRNISNSGSDSDKVSSDRLKSSMAAKVQLPLETDLPPAQMRQTRSSRTSTILGLRDDVTPSLRARRERGEHKKNEKDDK